MQNTILSIYSICGLSGREPTPHYIDSIRSIIAQNLDGHQIVISGCCTTDGTKVQLEGYFGDSISYNWVEEPHPLSITVNDSVDKAVKHYGPFEGYFYIDSGIDLWDTLGRWDALPTLYNVFKSGPYALCAAMPSNDDGHQWWGIQYKSGEDYIFPVGKATNMHAQIFSEEWRNSFNRLIPDIFGSNCLESVLSGMCSSIHRKFIITQKVTLKHAHSLEGASLYSRSNNPDFKPMSKIFPTGGHLYKTKKDMDARYAEGRSLGFGWEECSEYWRHDPDCFDADGYAKNPELKTFLAREMYLSKEEFDYSTIKSIWKAGYRE